MVEQINDKPTLRDVWNFITHGQDRVFEVRIPDTSIAVNIAKQLNIPFSASGVYVRSYKELYNVLNNIRKTSTAWISVNSKRKSFSDKHQRKMYNGSDASIDEILNVMIDIDRYQKGDKPSSVEEKKKLNTVANMIIRDLQNSGVASYMKVDSGNGIQIVIPIEPSWMPLQEYDESLSTYVMSEDAERRKNLVRSTLGAMIVNKYSKVEYRRDYNAEVDASSFNIGRVMALHGTYNFKYQLPILRRAFYIVTDTENHENHGLTDEMFEQLQNVVISHKGSISSSNVPHLDVVGEKCNYTENTISQSPLSKLLTRTKLPRGGRHNYLVFPLKVLVFKNNIPFNSDGVKRLRRQIENVQEKKFPFNKPSRFSIFSTNTVNRYCMMHGLPLLYEPLPQNSVKQLFKDWVDEYPQIFSWYNYTLARSYYQQFGHPNVRIQSKSSVFDDVMFIRSAIQNFIRNPSKYDRRVSVRGLVAQDIIEWVAAYVFYYEEYYSERIIKSIVTDYLPKFVVK